MYTTLYDYTAQAPNQMSFSKGKTVRRYTSLATKMHCTKNGACFVLAILHLDYWSLLIPLS